MSAKQNVASVMDNLQNYCPTMSYSLPHESTQTSGQAPFFSTQYSCSSSLLLPLLLFLFLPEVYFYKACIFVKRVFSRCIYKGIFFRNAHIGGGGGGRPCGWWCSLGPHFFLLKTSEECFNSPPPHPTLLHTLTEVRNFRLNLIDITKRTESLKVSLNNSVPIAILFHLTNRGFPFVFVCIVLQHLESD